MQGKARSAWWRGLACALALLVAWAPAAQAQRGKDAPDDSGVEASMLVTGKVTIRADGTVGEWSIDQREALPAAVVNVIDAAAPGWRFEPILLDGKPVAARATMSLRLVAEPEGDRRFRVVIRHAYFGRDALAAVGRLRERTSRAEEDEGSEWLLPLRLTPPPYPEAAARSGVQGTVYLVLLVDRKGSVRDSIAEQVNLRVWSSMRELERLRKMLGLAAVEASRRWRFQPPTRGEHADAEQWTVLVPVEFRLMGDQGPEYGKWQVYVPGPRTRAPWIIEGMDDIDLVPDTLVAGGVYQAGMARRMLGQLQGN